MQKKGRKNTTIFFQKPYGDAVLAPFSKRLSPKQEVNILIDKRLENKVTVTDVLQLFIFPIQVRLSDCTLPFRTNTTSENQLNDLNFILIRVSAQSVDSGD